MRRRGRTVTVDVPSKFKQSRRKPKDVTKKKNVVVAGLGEVGKPLLELVSKYHDAVGVDISPAVQQVKQVDVLHICYPFQIKDFIGETARYIELFGPALTVVNSTGRSGPRARLLSEPAPRS